MRLALSLLLPLLRSKIAISTSCQFNYEVDCNNPYSANAWVTFIDPNYFASVTFHWGQQNTDIGPQQYSSSTQSYVGDFFNFGTVGEFNVGATVTFGEGSGCNGQMMRRNQTLWFEESACGLSGEDEETNVPTVSPANNIVATTPRPTLGEGDRTTFIPTEMDVLTAVPTSKSSLDGSISTNTPTLKPSSPPSKKPTNKPVKTTTSPSKHITTKIPSKSPVVSLTTVAPSLSVDDITDPNSKEETREYGVASRMVLYYMESMDEESEQSWIDVTHKTIQREVAAMTGIEPKKVEIDIVLESLDKLPLSRKRMMSVNDTVQVTLQKRFRRRQQSLIPIEIHFNTSIRFSSERDDWDANQMVAAAFQTQKEQTKYIVELKIENMDHFWSVEKLTMEVDGELVTEPSTTVVDEGTVSVYFVVALAVGGVILLILALATGMYCAKRKANQKKKDARSALKSQQTDPDRVGLEIETKSDTLNHPQSYFGTIRSKEDSSDDISTLGDPFMGDAFPVVMDTDNTVDESLVSSQQQLYICGVGRSQTNCMESRMGDSTINSGSKVMMFREDTTLEDIYQSPSGTSDDTLDVITVVAPEGPLGIVLDNPLGTLPVIYAIRETSSLIGKVCVGDLLMSVDEVDCRGMSSHNVSLFLNSRSNHPERTLVLARCAGMDGLVTAEAV